MPVLSRPLEHTMPDSDEGVQNDVKSKTGIQPCLWQIAVVRLILEQQDVITVAATGSGKSLTYWMALLYIKYGIVLLVTPLKLLGKEAGRSFCDEIQHVGYASKNGCPMSFMCRTGTSQGLYQKVKHCREIVFVEHGENFL